MGTKLVVFASLVSLLLLFGCASKSAPVPTLPEETIPQAPVTEEWQKQWEQTLLEARKEGKVVIHIGAGISPEVRQEFARQVKAKYGLELEMTAGRVVEQVEKILRERKAGLYLADLVVNGIGPAIFPLKSSGVLDPLEQTLILPEVKDLRVWLEERLPFIDKDKKVFAFASYVSTALTTNTDLVKKEEIASYRDLLSPKWRGKIAMNDPSIASSGSVWFSAIGLRVLGMDYVRELAKQDIMFSRDLRLLGDWLVKGKYPIGIALPGGATLEYIKAGAPLYEYIPKEGGYLTSGSGEVVLLNKAPHPNAARIFINWLLSKEGQIIYSRGMDNQSARVDIPTDFLSSQRVRKPGIPYFNTNTEEFRLKQGEELLLAKEIFNIR